MLNSKQRAWLRAQANALEPGFLIGKGELTPASITDLEAMLTTHELIKIAVLKTAASDIRQLAASVGEAVQAEVIQIVGRRIVIYRQSEKLMKAGKSLQLP
ncbi:MAG: YhbY family RNA-binding protein [Bacillota bacterium]|nr:YhbY family RNA-binding protein [Bacillota bacterium]